MKLICMSIEGFRRFAERNTVRLCEPLIAIVGPNEAGKSSFLSALRQLETKEPIATRDLTRRENIEPKLSVTFELDDDDQKTLDQLRPGMGIRRFIVEKGRDGLLSFTLQPTPTHDVQPRRDAAISLAHALNENLFGLSGNAKEQEARLQRPALSILESDFAFLGKNEIRPIRNVCSALKSLLESNALSSDQQEYARTLEKTFLELIEHESTNIPQRAREILADRRPSILYFDEAARDLRYSYDLSDDTERSSVALRNLAQLADLDLADLMETINQNDKARLLEIQDEANQKLKEAFSAAWVRKDVVPRITIEGTALYLLVSTPDKSGWSSIDERSDGLRWFISLVAFMNRQSHAIKPILLVDEAERHLSYDAQASIVDVLETQSIAQTIIYTTHSAGCLPSDLGTGVRPVVPLKGQRSKIENGFWTIGEGFSPLMLAMGLGPLAFTAARNVLIGEGPSECLALPSLIRQAANKTLHFQIAPGASTVSLEDIPNLLAEGGRVAFVLDGDDAGDERKSQLLAAGVPAKQVVTYADLGEPGLVFEDLIDPESYVTAFNDELKRWQGTDKRLSVGDLPKIGRPKTVDTWCEQHGLKPVTKPTLCQRIAEEAAKGQAVLSDKGRSVLEKLYDWTKSAF